MLEQFPHSRDRFVLIPDRSHETQQYLVYDSLLEQAIGQPQATIHSGLDFVSHLNRATQQFFPS